MCFMESGLWKTKKLGMMVGDTQTYLFYADKKPDKKSSAFMKDGDLVLQKVYNI